MLNLHRFLISSFVVFCVIDGGLFKDLPDYIHVCKRDPNTIEDCARKSIEDLRPILKTGIKELNVPGLDPFFIKEIKALTGDTPIRASGKDVVVTGASSFKIKGLSVDLDTLTIKVNLLMPKLHFEGEYELEAKLFTIPLMGKGKFNADAVKCNVEVLLHTLITIKEGKEYIKFNNIDVDIKVKDYSLMLEGLFGGDKTLGEAANEAINQNKGEFFRVIKSYAEKTIGRDLLETANNIVEGLTLDQLLPKP